MANVSSKFPLDPADDELFQFTCLPSQSNTIQHLQGNELPFANCIDTTHLPRKRNDSQKGKYLSAIICHDKDDNHRDKKKMKMIHRDVERQRRQEMAVL